jgi:hypothetical protein
MTDISISNIQETHVPIQYKELTAQFIPTDCSFEIGNAPSEIGNCIVRVLGYEKEGYSLEVDHEDIRITSGDINIMEIYYNIILAPLRYDMIDDDLASEMFIDVHNTTTSSMLITFEHLQYKSSYKPDVLTHPHNQIIYINPGDKLQIKNIRVIKGMGHARFINISAPRSFPLDRKMSDDKIYAFDDKTAISNPRHHIISFEVPTARLNQTRITKKLIIIACDIILTRLENIQYLIKTESIDILLTDTELSFEYTETNTIAKLLERISIDKLKKLKSITSIIVYPDDKFVFKLYIDVCYR